MLFVWLLLVGVAIVVIVIIIFIVKNNNKVDFVKDVFEQSTKRGGKSVYKNNGNGTGSFTLPSRINKKT